ncbi:MAG: SulP family inorganic anion transporter, partial [Chryseobacterium sp.]
MRSFFATRATSLRDDFMASVVVFLIALPFSMGVALASGAPIHAGLIPGAIAAIVAGLFGGAPLVVSGPAATVSVLVYEMSEGYG